MALPGPFSDPPVALLHTRAVRQLRLHSVRRWLTARDDGGGQAAPVPGRRAFHGLAQVVPQVPAVTGLDGQRGTAGR